MSRPTFCKIWQIAPNPSKQRWLHQITPEFPFFDNGAQAVKLPALWCARLQVGHTTLVHRLPARPSDLVRKEVWSACISPGTVESTPQTPFMVAKGSEIEIITLPLHPLRCSPLRVLHLHPDGAALSFQLHCTSSHPVASSTPFASLGFRAPAPLFDISKYVGGRAHWSGHGDV